MVREWEGQLRQLMVQPLPRPGFPVFWERVPVAHDLTPLLWTEGQTLLKTSHSFILHTFLVTRRNFISNQQISMTVTVRSIVFLLQCKLHRCGSDTTTVLLRVVFRITEIRYCYPTPSQPYPKDRNGTCPTPASPGMGRKSRMSVGVCLV